MDPFEDYGIKQIFTDDGLVRGLYRRLKPSTVKPYDVLECKVYNPKTQKSKSFTIKLKKFSFDEAYQMAQERILKIKGIKPSPMIADAFAACMSHYSVNHELERENARADLEKLAYSTRLI